jgi:hypothetical protein
MNKNLNLKFFFKFGIFSQPIIFNFKMGFAVVVPTRPVESNFQQVSKTRWVKNIDNKIPISEILIFKLPNTEAIPEGFELKKIKNQVMESEFIFQIIP